MNDQELNEAVARKLGWHEVVGAHPAFRGKDRLFALGDRLAKNFPDYCYDIREAWEIIKHCDMVTYIQCPSVGGKKWHVDIGNCGWTEDNSVTRAICLAFLKLEGDLK